MSDPSRVRVSGPLEPFASGFALWLSGRGYPPSSAARQLQLMAHVSRWLLAEGLGARELSDDAVEAFVVSRRACGYSGHRTSRALVGLLFYLRDVGAVPVAAETSPEGPVERLLYCYRRYLVVERGVGASTIRGYVRVAGQFLDGRVCSDGLGLEHLRAGDVMAFVVARCPSQSQGSARLTVRALRSLLGFLYLEGVIDRPLASAVPSVASWRLSGLPKGLSREEVAGLLESCDRGSVVGRRDLAMLMLLARLGLRAGEVARLELDEHRLAGGRDRRARQGRSPRAAAVAWRHRRDDHGLSAWRAPDDRSGTDGLRSGDGSSPRAHRRWRERGSGTQCATGGAGCYSRA